MQKKIIALAVAAAFSAPAFADTTVYGIVDAAVANMSANNLKSDTLVFSGGLAASRVGVKSSEDLTNGMKASVVLEYGLDIATNQQAVTPVPGSTSNGNGLIARQQMLALSGGFGTVAAGYLQTTGFDFSGKFDPTAGSLVSPLGNLTKGGSFMIGNQASLKRAGRALAYISPDMSGLTVAVNYATDAASTAGLGNLGVASGATTGLKTTATLVSADYKMDALTVGAVFGRTANESDGNNGTAREMALGANYDFGAAKVFATYQIHTIDGAQDSDKVMSLSAAVPVTTAGTAAVSYAKTTMTAANGTSLDKDASSVTVAWLQGLSKTTTAYVAYSTVSQGNDVASFSVGNGAYGNALANGDSSKMLAVGLNKKF